MYAGYDTPDECLYPSWEEILEHSGIDTDGISILDFEDWHWDDIISYLREIQNLIKTDPMSIMGAYENCDNFTCKNCLLHKNGYNCVQLYELAKESLERNKDDKNNRPSKIHQ